MINVVHHSRWISGLRRAALALAVMLLPVVVASRPARAQTFTLLHAFGASIEVSGGRNPAAGLVKDAAGNLYGTTQHGGISACMGGGLGCGSVFKLDTAGTETALHIFTGALDGALPAGAVVLDTAGNLYGTTAQGGASNVGTVFKVDPAGTETVLHSFTGAPDGAFPAAAVVLDTAGNLYGTTAQGGASNVGTVFKVDPAGTETVLHSFTGAPDGAFPAAAVVVDTAGNLYGTTAEGGVTAGICGNVYPPGCGVVFKVDASGTETVLHSFTGPPDGIVPEAGLILDAAGNLYGTTQWGGITDSLCAGFFPGCGVVFKVDASSNEMVLYSFAGQADGADPVAGVVQDAAGNLYGTTMQGGVIGPANSGECAQGCGVVFKLDPSGKETVLHTFTGIPDGEDIEAGLILDSSGNLYGTAKFGGNHTEGTVFKIDPLGPKNFPLTVATAGNGIGAGIVTSNPPGIDCSGVCSAFFITGTMITLTAKTAAGSGFVGWSGACSGMGTCNLIITSAESVSATFITDFSLSASAFTPSTVSPGASSTSTVNVTTTVCCFSGSVALSCAVQPTPALAPTCSISPNSTTPGTPATLTVRTTGPTAGALPSSSGSGLFYAIGLPLIGLVATGVRLGSVQKGKVTGMVPVCMLFAGLAFLVACGGSNSTNGGGSSGTPAGTYTITVTGTDTAGSLKHSATTMLKVQ
jgi:uncharacterized repeat protein (TIGR03803 family)